MIFFNIGNKIYVKKDKLWYFKIMVFICRIYLIFKDYMMYIYILEIENDVIVI